MANTTDPRIETSILSITHDLNTGTQDCARHLKLERQNLDPFEFRRGDVFWRKLHRVKIQNSIEAVASDKLSRVATFVAGKSNDVEKVCRLYRVRRRHDRARRWRWHSLHDCRNTLAENLMLHFPAKKMCHDVSHTD